MKYRLLLEAVSDDQSTFTMIAQVESGAPDAALETQLMSRGLGAMRDAVASVDGANADSIGRPIKRHPGRKNRLLKILRFNEGAEVAGRLALGEIYDGTRQLSAALGYHYNMVAQTHWVMLKLREKRAAAAKTREEAAIIRAEPNEMCLRGVWFAFVDELHDNSD